MSQYSFGNMLARRVMQCASYIRLRMAWINEEDSARQTTVLTLRPGSSAGNAEAVVNTSLREMLSGGLPRHNNKQS